MKEILQAHPEAPQNTDFLVKVVTECGHCAMACTACADACLAEPNVAELRNCISLDQTCADICLTVCRVLCRVADVGIDLSASLLEVCMQICGACAEECERHADMHEHCRICAAACRRCEEVCLVDAEPQYLTATAGGQ
jgi:hypothetical protein